MDAPGHIQTKDDDTWIQCPCCKSLLNINSRSEHRMIVFDVTQMLWLLPRPRSPCSMWLVCRLDPYGAPVMCFTHSECTFSHLLLVSILSLLSFQQIHGFNRGLFNIQVGKLSSTLCYLCTSNTRWQGLNESGDANPLNGQGHDLCAIGPFITEHCIRHLTNLTVLWLLSELVYMTHITIPVIEYVPRTYGLFCSL